MVDKNLFPYDLAVVAIMKNEAPYLKEWLDYHLMAGVDHFYLYDNDSPDNQREIAKPYIDAGIVDYIDAPGKMMQLFAYNDAVKRFKFRCRYMAFIDLDEFIFPKSNRSIVEVVDETLSRDSNIAGMSIHWQFFGSNGQETADYSRGVLERFTRRAPSDDELNKFVKTIADPRKIKYLQTMHFAYFFEPFRAVDENFNDISDNVLLPIAAEKMVANHYYAKSKEEYINTKMQRGWACGTINPYDDEQFNVHDRNEIFDDGILNYRNERAENFSLESKTQRFNRVTEALTENLSSSVDMETALTCRAISTYLRKNFPADDDYWRICEEASLAAVIKSLRHMTIAEAQLFIKDFPNLLRLSYPVAKELRIAARQIISQLKNFLQSRVMWQEFVELDYVSDLLEE